ncbi:hypothetical protein PsYK624_086280 [Phanerochaete sordida]|uniref:Uncharacterized protein n=1 Tax=Phanerochaete sordida TaxID=48140 RepID=A0A9P3GDR0_9APHY|nr:hypothetical protein PsYK624_086280 [Phanerochaete sordida]
MWLVTARLCRLQSSIAYDDPHQVPLASTSTAPEQPCHTRDDYLREIPCFAHEYVVQKIPVARLPERHKGTEEHSGTAAVELYVVMFDDVRSIRTAVPQQLSVADYQATLEAHRLITAAVHNAAMHSPWK